MYAKYCLILADDCLCHHNDHLNNLLGHNDLKNVSGWKVDIISGQYNHHVWGTEHWAQKRNYYERCGSGKKWFGWKTSPQVGSINTILFGCGNAKLDFGNCYDFGEVVAYKNGKEIGMANASENKTIAFEFFDGDSIVIQAHDLYSAMLLNDFVQDPCPGESKIFIHKL